MKKFVPLLTVAIVAFLLGSIIGPMRAATPLAPITLQPGQQITIIAADLPTPTATIVPTPTVTPTVSPSPTITPLITPTPSPTTVPTGTPLPATFVGTSGTQFILNGQPFTFTGFNIYQANSISNCSVTMGNGNALDVALTDSGATVFRAWFFQRLATTNGARNWSAFDHTLAVAKAHGVKVIVTLGNQWGSCESSTGVYKTDAWYKSGYKTDILPENTVPYRQWVQEVVTRYKNDPTILMWQLMNEAEIKTSESSSCAPTVDLYNFASDVSGLVKSIDSNHIINLGTMGGGQCGSQGSDYKLINSISTLDVCEFHDYNHDTTPLPTNLSSDITACNALNKPIFVGEAGIKGTTLSNRASEFNNKLSAQFNAGIKGFLIWSWKTAPTSGSYEVGPGDPTIAILNSY